MKHNKINTNIKSLNNRVQYILVQCSLQPHPYPYHCNPTLAALLTKTKHKTYNTYNVF